MLLPDERAALVDYCLKMQADDLTVGTSGNLSVRSGDLIAIMSAGAYGAVQAGTYNSRLLVPEVLVRGADAAVVRPRQSYEDLIGLDRVPDWLTPQA